MATEIESFAIEFPEGYDERTEYEIPFKGYLSGVTVRLENGSGYRLCFYDPVRLQQTVQDESRLGRPCFTEPNLVVVPEVTTESVRASISFLFRAGSFKAMKALPESV